MAKVTVWPTRRQIVIYNDRGAATVSIGPTGELITVDDQDGDNHYIGYSGQRAQIAVERILHESISEQSAD